MRHGRFEIRKLSVAGAAVLLLTGGAGMSFALGNGVEPAPADQEKSDVGPRGCPGCCSRTAAAGEGSGCRRAGEGQGGCCGSMGRQSRRGSGQGHGQAWRGGGRGPAGRGAGHGGGPPAVMQTARALVHDYRQEIQRQVEEVENGVVTVTRAPSSAEAAQAIARHVREMQQLLENGGRVRLWDPLFRELFDHADQISLEVEEIEGGLRVTETSDDPQVVELIRAHARKVTEFLERGPAAVHEKTPLPKGYGQRAEPGVGSMEAANGNQEGAVP